MIRSHHVDLLRAASSGEFRLSILSPPGRSPNPRVQRTRSSPSARHSPLTRHPLGRGIRLRFVSLAGNDKLLISPPFLSSRDERDPYTCRRIPRALEGH